MFDKIIFFLAKVNCLLLSIALILLVLSANFEVIDSLFYFISNETFKMSYEQFVISNIGLLILINIVVISTIIVFYKLSYSFFEALVNL